MKKNLFIFSFIFVFSFNNVYAKDNLSDAKSSVLMDVKTGRVLYSSNCNLKLPMASTTKIITVLLALENAGLNEIVKVSRKASIQEGSSVYLKEGERIFMEDLLYCVMLRSGNDAAVAVAEHISGSVESFAKLMNSRAYSIGAKNTNFENPHGLPNDNHYTTSHDLALITREALLNKKFAEIVSTKNYTVSKLLSERKILQNKNKMLWEYEGGNGVKTGYTGKAGKCLVSSATKDEWQLLTVVLNSSDMWKSSKNLLDYGFKNYDNIKIVDKCDYMENIEVRKGKEKSVQVVPRYNLHAPLLRIGDGYENLTFVHDLPSTINAPIKKNEIAGSLKVYANNFLLGEVDLLYNNDVKSSDILYNMKRIIINFFN